MKHALILLILQPLAFGLLAGEDRPNIIFIMADDLGIAHVETYGFDDGYPGQIQTPNLNAMAANGIRFDRFYSHASVCSPTRFSCYTGRHPYRIGMWEANIGHLRTEEITLPEIFKEHGYTIGHFGKWHMGRMVEEENLHSHAKRMGHASPSDNGVDEWFAIHTAPYLYNPFSDGRPSAEESDNPFYHNGKRVTDNVDGDTSRIIMDRAIPFIENTANDKKPFVAYIWFNTPHKELSANPKYKDIYEKWELYGPIADMDEQVGRLRKKLRQLGIEKDTLLWFSSDNGPAQGTAGPYNAGKRTLFEGGIRVPTFAEWPGKLEAGRIIDSAACSSDYLPTALAAAGIEYRPPHPLDGENILPILLGNKSKRDEPIFFQSHGSFVAMDQDYKLMKVSENGYAGGAAKKAGHTLNEWLLFDMQTDSSETMNIAAEHPERVEQMIKRFTEWDMSCKNSFQGKDYDPALNFKLGKKNVYRNDATPKSGKKKKSKKGK